MKLIIVESPNKASTIERWLGKEYKVLASGGHVRDLPESSFGIDFEKDFAPKYVIAPKKRETISRLKDAKAKAEYVYLATDPDREGEAISWHLAKVLGINEKENNRIEFNEITEKAIKEAIKTPRHIDLNLVDAQQARRVLDRIVGYTLSPIICKRIQPKLSAGRVQSVALKLVVDKEREIQAFVPKEYWNICAKLFANANNKLIFKASLYGKNGKKYVPANKEEADEVIRATSHAPFTVKDLKKAVTKTHAPAPFTTSTMQQDAANKLNLSSSVTMKLAQNLYEGINLPGEGHVALITYIRTDSVRVSQEAVAMAKSYIEHTYGEEYYPDKPNVYKTKKSAQDAHEAIRPISLARTPQSLEGKLDRNQLRLYKLIYERFVASQMAEAKHNSVNVEIASDAYTFKANGKTLLFKGFLAAYSSYKEEESDDEGTNAKIPEMSIGETLNLKELTSEQKFTKPPLRYTDATLIKALEEDGIGRPSTYATILTVLLKREYTHKDGKFIVPTDVAFNVTDYLTEYFAPIMKESFTANVEKQLDEIEEGGIKWQEIVRDFYDPFSEMVRKSKSSFCELSDEKCPKCGAYLYKKIGKYGAYYECAEEGCGYKRSVTDVLTDKKCDKCGSPMLLKSGKFGKYYACSNYPACSNTMPFEDDVTDEVCEKCGSPMIIKNGKFGKFLACSNYPTCENTKPVEKPVAKCPKCGKDVYLKKSKKGNTFYGCSGYPECDFVSWDLPLEKKCPKCGEYLVEKTDRSGKKSIKCSNKDCNYSEKD